MVEASRVTFLRSHGYMLDDTCTWRQAPSGMLADEAQPRLDLQLRGHKESCGHTWYSIGCLLAGATGNQQWQKQRRLVQLRKDLHDRIKEDLGGTYKQHFDATPFPHRGGLPGTSARLQAWLNALASCINEQALPARTAAMALQYLTTAPHLQTCLVDDPGFGSRKSQSALEKRKVVFLGDSSVGKTALINRLCYGEYFSPLTTIGNDFRAKTVYDEGSPVRLQLWDVNGSDRFRELVNCVVRDAACIVLVYDITRHNTLGSVVDFRKRCKGNPAVILLGSQADFEATRQVSVEEGNAMAQELGAVFFAEVSAKSGVGTDNLFSEIARSVRRHRVAVTIYISPMEPRGLQISCVSLAGHNIMTLRMGGLDAHDKAMETLQLLMDLVADQLKLPTHALRLVLPSGGLVATDNADLHFSDMCFDGC